MGFNSHVNLLFFKPDFAFHSSFVVAENILKTKTHTFESHELQVSSLESHRQTTKANEIAGENLEATCAILVQGLNSNIGNDVIEMFFENTKRSGGGEIKQLQVFPKEGRAIIWFADVEGKKVFLQ